MAKCGTISIVLSIFTLNWTTNQLLNIVNGFRNVADISREEKTWFLGKRWLIGPLLDLGSGGCKWLEVNASSMIFLLKCQLLSTTYSINLINFWVSLDFFTENRNFSLLFTDDTWKFPSSNTPFLVTHILWTEFWRFFMKSAFQFSLI